MPGELGLFFEEEDFWLRGGLFEVVERDGDGEGGRAEADAEEVEDLAW